MSRMSESRRRFLVGTTLAATAAPWIAHLVGSPVRAQDLPPLPGDNATAVALAYTENAAETKHASFKAGSLCANCQFFTGKAGEARGPCTLFPNFSVASKGWCSAWAQKPA